MDELGELRATSPFRQGTEDVTGAVADSINYTVEELRSLVRGINNATEQMDQAANQAGQIYNHCNKPGVARRKKLKAPQPRW